MKNRKTKQGQVAVSCGDCEGLSRRALQHNGEEGKPAKVCSETGALPESKPCAKFRPDVFSLDEDERIALRQLSALVKKFDEKGLRVVASIFMNEHKTRKYGVRFGQRMFVRYRSYVKNNYTSNFMACTVMDAGDGVIRLMSADGKTALTYAVPDNGVFNGPVLYDAQAFRPLLKQMKREKKFFDPKAETAKRLLPEEDVTFKKRKDDGFADAIMNIGDVIRSKPKRKRGAKSDKSVVDLCDMVVRVERGEHLGRYGSDDFTDDDVQVLAASSYSRNTKARKLARKKRAGLPSDGIELSSMID